MGTTQITVLVENTARGPGLLAEHGLAYWIEHAGRHVLLDTGQGNALLGNAYKLGVALNRLDTLVLSHGHYDHAGGVADALRTPEPVTVYAHAAALTPKYARQQDGTGRDIGLSPVGDKALRNPRHRLVPLEQPAEIAAGLTVTGPVPRVTDFEDTGGPFFLDPACTQPDPLTDDQSVFFDTPEGCVVLLGCAHSGVINTLRYIRQLTGGRPFRIVLGGMHLGEASPARIARTIAELRQLGVPRVGPAHCTGMPATVALWQAFPGRFVPCHVGARLQFET